MEPDFEPTRILIVKYRDKIVLSPDSMDSFGFWRYFENKEGALEVTWEKNLTLKS